MLLKVDPIFKSFWILKFINKLFKCGKKRKILNRIYNLFSSKSENLDLELMFIESLEILRVPLSLKKFSKRYEVPFPISEYYQYKKGLSWFVDSVLKNKLPLEGAIIFEIKSIINFNLSCNSLQQKKKYELYLYKNRFFKIK